MGVAIGSVAVTTSVLPSAIYSRPIEQRMKKVCCKIAFNALIIEKKNHIGFQQAMIGLFRFHSRYVNLLDYYFFIDILKSCFVRFRSADRYNDTNVLEKK